MERIEISIENAEAVEIFVVAADSGNRVQMVGYLYVGIAKSRSQIVDSHLGWTSCCRALAMR
jgi:hypothetical protein